ncbi:MAG: metallophosphoesterase family protein [Acidobacteriaceae bacterium]
MMVLGVLADTHVPDRVPQLDRRVLHVFRQAHVQAILHAGDVSVPEVLHELEQEAPVYAVRGNRDILSLRSLPMRLELDINGVSIGMAHGHGTFSRYMVDKLQRALKGRLVERYLTRMLQAFPQAEVIVFGHLHVPCNFHLQGKLLFNPGSTSYPWPRAEPPTFGLLHVDEGIAPRGEIIPLD